MVCLGFEPGAADETTELWRSPYTILIFLVQAALAIFRQLYDINWANLFLNLLVQIFFNKFALLKWGPQ